VGLTSSLGDPIANLIAGSDVRTKFSTVFLQEQFAVLRWDRFIFDSGMPGKQIAIVFLRERFADVLLREHLR
jgi:hypothetical protein